MITKPSPRVIIDTHAGTGMVNYIRKDIMGKEFAKRIYGSPLLAILKTITISKNLLIILNEKDPDSFSILKSFIQHYTEKGIPIFVQQKQKFKIKDLKTQRKKNIHYNKKMKEFLSNKRKKIFPSSPKERPRKGYREIFIKSNADIKLYDKKIEVVMDNILKKVKTYKKIVKPFKSKALFFVDPCGSVSWNNVIKKICKRASGEEGTDLIINWCWDVINRNPHNLDIQLHKMYGIPLDDIEQEFKHCRKMEDYLDKYIEQLRQYFKYINIPVQVKKSFKLIPKGKIKYVLLFCTNNPSGNSLAGYKEEKNIKKRRKNFGDMKDWI